MPSQTNNSSNRISSESTDAKRLSDSALAKPLHPEDLSVGDDVAILFTSCQYPTFVWYGFDSGMQPIEKPISVTYLPLDDQEALVVEQICLPFVLCRRFDDRHRYLDVRQVQLARLNKAFAKADRKARRHDQEVAARENPKTTKRKKRRKKKKKPK
jgi:hypothetical protein